VIKKYCVWCDDEFATKIGNQIYCSPKCRDAATKEKIMERYKFNKIKNRQNKERRCSNGCGTLLSIYNNSGFCTACMTSKKQLDKTLKEIKNLANDDK
jgi:predicted nucleic acid-binding Zn ribbon protein